MDDIVSKVRSAVELGRESDLSFLAGSIAFFAFFSIVPALLLAMAMASILGGDQFVTRAMALVQTYLSEEGSEVINEALTDPSGAVGASIVGVVGLLWSALKVFRSIDIAFDRIYGADATTSLPRQILNGLVVLLAIGAGTVLLIVVQIAIARLGLSGRASLIGVPVLIVGLLVVLMPVFYVMPPRSVSAREIVPGTIIAAFGILVLQLAFQIYTSSAGQYQAYGFLGVVLLFMLWLYFGALILLFGAVVNVTLGR